MLNKKNNDTLKIVGIVTGTVAGIAAVAAGVFAAYKYYKTKIKCCCGNCEESDDCKEDWLVCDECEIAEKCECHGKYACDCDPDGNCLVEECTDIDAEDFGADKCVSEEVSEECAVKTESES